MSSPNDISRNRPAQVSSTAEIFAALTSLCPRVPRRNRRSSRFVSVPKTVAQVRTVRCQCGACGACQDNARWERIYNEKFASPEYYRLGVLQNWSTLSRK